MDNKNKNDEDQSRFLEAPFVRMLRMRSASLKIDKTQNYDLFISPKWKITILEMTLKSSITSKLDHQMSRN